MRTSRWMLFISSFLSGTPTFLQSHNFDPCKFWCILCTRTVLLSWKISLWKWFVNFGLWESMLVIWCWALRVDWTHLYRHGSGDCLWILWSSLGCGCMRYAFYGSPSWWASIPHQCFHQFLFFLDRGFHESNLDGCCFGLRFQESIFVLWWQHHYCLVVRAGDPTISFDCCLAVCHQSWHLELLSFS